MLLLEPRCFAIVEYVLALLAVTSKLTLAPATYRSC